MGDTPVPIPNTMVKTHAADGTWLETARESRWLPDSFSKESDSFEKSVIGAKTGTWGCSSVGRAPALQAGGQEFEPLHLHRNYVPRQTNSPGTDCRYLDKFILIERIKTIRFKLVHGQCAVDDDIKRTDRACYARQGRST